MTMNKFSVFLIATGGTLLEWAEYILYAYLAHHFSVLYFPSSDPITAIVASYSVLAMGFVMRPLGAWFFGHIGDTYGRKPALTYSLLLMGVATAGIGCMPTYAHIGYYAAFGLAFCRLIQGFALGGEFHGAGIYLVEHSKSNPFFTGSWISASAALGMVLGASIASIVTLPTMPTWAWRVPFIVGGIVYGIIFWRRKSLPESPALTNPKEHHTRPNTRPSWRLFLFIIALSALVGTYVYVANVYFVTFLISQLSFSVTHATLWAMLAQCFVTCFIPLFGWSADHWIRPYYQLCFATFCAMAFAPFFFMSALKGTTWGLFGYILPYAIINGMITGPMITTMVRLFPARQRYRGIAITWNIAAAIFGGAAPIVAVEVARFSPIYPGFYISAVSAVALIIILSSKKIVQPRIESPH